MKIAVAGAGASGGEHLRTLWGLDGIKIAGIADVKPAAARAPAGRFGANDADHHAVALTGRLHWRGLTR